MDSRRRYLDLLKRALNNYLYLGEGEDFTDYDTITDSRYSDSRWTIPEWGIPHTLLRMPQFESLEYALFQVIKHRVPGDFFEAGVYRGGAVIFMRAVLDVCGDTDRTVWAADTFGGIPAASKHAEVEDEVKEWDDRWIAGLDEVKARIQRYGLLDDRIRFLEGPFSETLPGARLGDLAVVRLDADAYESTRDAIEVLYPKIPEGGFLIIDDWHLDACRRAVNEYREAKGIEESIAGVMGTRDYPYEAFWQVKNRITE